MIAVENMLQAPADGYTLLMVFSGVVTVNHSCIKYQVRPDQDLVGIANSQNAQPVDCSSFVYGSVSERADCSSKGQS